MLFLFVIQSIGMYLHGFEKPILPDINKRSSLATGREMGAGRNLSHRIIKSADYLQPIKMLILSTELFLVLTQWVVFCIVHYIMQSAMMAYI